MEDYFQLVQHEYKRWQETKGGKSRFEMSLPQLSLVEVKCETINCPFFMSVSTQPYCHECFDRKQKSADRTKTQIQKGESIHRRPEYCESSCPMTEESLPDPSSALATAPSLFIFSETNAMKCKTADCPFTLNVELNGLCEHCHNARIPQLGSSAERVKPSSIIRCTICFQDATRTFNGICSSCFKRTTERSHSSSFSSSLHQSSGPVNLPRSLVNLSRQQSTNDETQASTTSLQCVASYNAANQKCKKAGCQYFGTLYNEGFCTLCFFEYKENTGR